MGKDSKIGWTHHTFNPWHGCTKVSPACKNCYAREVAARWGNDVWGKYAPRKFMSDTYWKQPLRWNRAAGRHRVFCGSMCDWAEILPSGHSDAARMSEARHRLWDLIESTPNLDWLLLTKRSENIGTLLPYGPGSDAVWPNVWLGVTAENQEQADIRIPALLRANCVKRFVSYEPALGAVDLRKYLWPVRSQWSTKYRSAQEALEAGATVTRHPQSLLLVHVPLVDWVIAGCESGPGKREMDIDWVRSVRDQCSESKTPFYLKQMIDVDGKKIDAPMLDGRQWQEVPT